MIPAIIGASMRIKGEIRSKEPLQVDGEIDGKIESQQSLHVGPKGKVKADIIANEVTVLGVVEGNVAVTGRISIKDHGSLVGDIVAAGIVIDEGAYFKGSIDLVRNQPVKD